MKCKICNKEFSEWSYKDSLGRIYKPKNFCSKECKKKNYTIQYRKKYGDKPTRTQESILKSAEKMKKTMMKRYGVTNASQLEHVKKIHRNPEVQKKREFTMLKRYGVINQGQLQQSKNSAKKAREEGKCGFGSKAYKDSILKNYGVDNPMKNPFIYNKMVKTKEKKGLLHKSEAEDYIYSLISNSIDLEIKRSYPIGGEKSFELDIYIPDLKLAFEYNGMYWHSQEHGQYPKNYHKMKTQICKAKGIRLIHIYEWEWIEQREMIEKFILFSINENVKKIYARKCKIKEVDWETYKKYCSENHLQGAQSDRHSKDLVIYGLYYKDELVQLMSFDHPQRNKNYEWEIVRGCPGSMNHVIGGVSKLFNHFVKEKNPNTVMSYCDFDKFDGRGYYALGMELDKWSQRMYQVWQEDSHYKFSSYSPRQEKNRKIREEKMKKGHGVTVYTAGTGLFVWKKACF